jgi:hypothetical protein
MNEMHFSLYCCAVTAARAALLTAVAPLLRACDREDRGMNTIWCHCCSGHVAAVKGDDRSGVRRRGRGVKAPIGCCALCLTSPSYSTAPAGSPLLVLGKKVQEEEV